MWTATRGAPYVSRLSGYVTSCYGRNIRFASDSLLRLVTELPPLCGVESMLPAVLSRRICRAVGHGFLSLRAPVAPADQYFGRPEVIVRSAAPHRQQRDPEGGQRLGVGDDGVRVTALHAGGSFDC